MKNTYKLILFLLLITQASFGQDVKGYIKDAESKEALAGVNVFYKDKGLSVSYTHLVDGIFTRKSSSSRPRHLTNDDLSNHYTRGDVYKRQEYILEYI